ncbi:hypothetical protein [Paraburkholderia sp. ZP32-5]|uniref:hypothetical protein n=1 Tax=Paraburkholderia sp. ZP32-5 TaxID=2883245 RepID=UPI001F2D8836|nr:hypothetical protein [Paraburkholderia sp. ZP32-5]
MNRPNRINQRIERALRRREDDAENDVQLGCVAGAVIELGCEGSWCEAVVEKSGAFPISPNVWRFPSTRIAALQHQ